jgi:hypothetical protein
MVQGPCVHLGLDLSRGPSRKTGTTVYILFLE